MSKYQYKLTLEVEDGGRRTFTAEGKFDSQAEMQRSIPHDIASALQSTMNCPPSPMALAGARESDSWSLVGGLAFAYQEWDGESDFDECVKIVVDVDKLCGTNDEDRNTFVKSFLDIHGIKSGDHHEPLDDKAEAASTAQDRNGTVP